MLIQGKKSKLFMAPYSQARTIVKDTNIVSKLQFTTVTCNS